MATFRYVFSRWILAGAVLCGSFTSVGAAFAPHNPSFQGPPDLMRLGPSVETRVVYGSVEAKFSSRRNAVLNRLEELVLAHRAISVSA